MIHGHSCGTRIEKFAQSYCRLKGCGWVGPERGSVSEARDDAREHVNPSKSVVVGFRGYESPTTPEGSK